MKLDKVCLRQELGAAFLLGLLVLWLLPLEYGNPSNVDLSLWFFFVLSVSLMVPERLTPHLLAFWGLFFAALSLALAFGVPVVGFPEWAHGAYAICSGVAALALVGSAVVAWRKARAKG